MFYDDSCYSFCVRSLGPQIIPTQPLKSWNPQVLWWSIFSKAGMLRRPCKWPVSVQSTQTSQTIQNKLNTSDLTITIITTLHTSGTICWLYDCNIKHKLTKLHQNWSRLPIVPRCALGDAQLGYYIFLYSSGLPVTSCTNCCSQLFLETQ